MIKLLGILNITPDSFSDGGLYVEPEEALTQAQKLIDGGADIIDVGAQSTKPNAADVSLDEEWRRLEPILQILIETHPGQISLDTMKPTIAKRFVDLGGTIMNDVSGFQDPEMVEVAARMCSHITPRSPLKLRGEENTKNPFIIVNHFPGKTVEEVHEQEISSTNQVIDELMLKKMDLIKAGVPTESIVLDPGIGFGKTMELNCELLEFAKYVSKERVLIGHSRKRFLGEDRFDSDVNIKAGKQAVTAGAEFLRVHEVAGYKSSIAVFGGQGSQTDLAVDNFEVVLDAERMYADTMQAVCEKVSSGECEWGILPTYNTQGGNVPEALKALEKFPNVEECLSKPVKIEHCLAVQQGVPLKDIQIVVSHWQALAQTKEWLTQNLPDADREAVTSTRHGCALVADSLDDSIACVCPAFTADDYGLDIAAEHIAPENNYTTFVLIARRK